MYTAVYVSAKLPIAWRTQRPLPCAGRADASVELKVWPPEAIPY